MKSAVIALLALAIMAPGSSSRGAINPVLNYQGYLADTLGYTYPDGVHSIAFSIYDVPTSGTPLWTETQSVELKRGLVHAYLGSVTPFPDSLFTTQPLYLGVKYESNPEFAPRHQLAASVYSFLAANSEKLDGHSADHFAAEDDLTDAIDAHATQPSAHHTKTIDASELTQGTLDPARLPAISVDSDNIENGTVATVDLADSAVTSSKLAAGAVTTTHLSVGALSGEQIADGSLTGIDLADSSITGDKIAAGSIENEHLAGATFTGANIVNGSLTGADIQDGTIYGIDIGFEAVTSYNIDDGTITGDDITTATISGVKIIDGSIGNADLGYGSVGTAQLVDNSVRSVDVNDGSLAAVDMLDEPGVDGSYGAWIANVDTSVHSWLSVTISAPSSGYVLAIFSCITQIQSGEIAQAGVSDSPTSIGAYGEGKIISTAVGTGADLTIMATEIFPVSAGDFVVYGNVKAATSSTGNVDFTDGRLQAIYVPTGY